MALFSRIRAWNYSAETTRSAVGCSPCSDGFGPLPPHPTERSRSLKCTICRPSFERANMRVLRRLTYMLANRGTAPNLIALKYDIRRSRLIPLSQVCQYLGLAGRGRKRAGPIAGAFSSGRMLTRSTKWCASRRNAPTTSRSSMNSLARRGGQSACLSRTPNRTRRVDHRPIRVRDEDMHGSTARGVFGLTTDRPRRDWLCAFR